MPDAKQIGRTVRARAAEELRDRILTGRFRPGTRLDLDELTSEFGTSRTPVREALLELSYEGLVAVAPRSGITVIGVGAEDAIDNFAILAALTGKAAEWATTRITDAQLDELEQLAAAVFDDDDVVEGNRRFHRALNLASGSPRLLTYIRQAVRVVPTSYFALFPERESTSRAEHAALLEAIRSGDAAGARTIAETHVLDAGATLGEFLRAHADGEPAADAG
jgi:DNA-binding GntR family transcriptional regulator